MEGVAGNLTEAPDSGMPSREEMWEQAKQTLTEEDIQNKGEHGCRTGKRTAPLIFFPASLR